MMQNMRILALAGLGSLALTALPAAAQTLPELQDLAIQGEQINRSAALAGQRGQSTVDTSIIDEDAGVYILTLNKIFQISAGSALGYTDNPTRTSDSTGGSGFADFFASASVSTNVNNKVDLGFSVSANGREFFRDYGPSDRSIATAVSVGVPVTGPLYASLVGFGGYSFDGKFRNSTGFYGLSGTLSAALPVSSRALVRPGVGVVRQWSGTSENNSTSLSGSLDISYAISPDINVIGRAIVQKRWYDDFYEDVTFIKRTDTVYGASASLSWRAAKDVVLSTTTSYSKQDSPLFLTDYDVFEASVMVTAAFRF